MSHDAECLLCGGAFIEDLAGRLAREEPDAIAGLSQDVLRRRVRMAVQRASERGARSAAAIQRFVLLMFALEPEFDERYRVREHLSARSGSFDDCLLTMHGWSHPNIWYRLEPALREQRWSGLARSEESHDAPIVASSGSPAGADRPSQLSRTYGFQLDVPYVETPPDAVLTMLRVAQVGPSDTVLDLGCGDGRIAIAAAARFGATAIGIDLDPERVAMARAMAERAGVSGSVTFRRADLFDADFSVATVVTMFLLDTLNFALREKFQRELPPGARIVSWQYDIHGWPAETEIREGHGTIYSWRIEGNAHRASDV